MVKVGATEPGRDFVQWARQSLIPLRTWVSGPPWEDLAPLSEMVGDATTVAFGEYGHFVAESSEFRNRLFQYLVEEKEFTAIAIESGLVESLAVFEYVRGGPGQIDSVLADGIGWTFDCIPQNRALIEWLREYNADPFRAQEVNFYGFDVPGSPDCPQAKRGLNTALTETIRYLSQVDPSLAVAVESRLAPLMTHLQFDRSRPIDSPSYDRLNQMERDQFTATIAELNQHLEHRESVYTALSSPLKYRWAYRAAIGARQLDEWLRLIPVGWQPSDISGPLSPEEASLLFAQLNSRDRAQAENVEWIIRQEGRSGKVFLYAHWGHLSSAPVTFGFLPAGIESMQQVAGNYLRRRLGQRLVTICHCAAEKNVGCPDSQHSDAQALSELLMELAAGIGASSFLLDLRKAPLAIKNWLDQVHLLGQGSLVFKTVVGGAFDLLYYTATATPLVRTAVTSHRS